MEIHYKFYYDANTIYQWVLKSLYEDAKANSNKDVRLTQLKPGFRYTKQLKQGSYSYYFKKLSLEEGYELHVTSPNGVRHIRFELHVLAPQETDVSYYEHFEPNANVKNGLWFRFANRRLEKQSYKRMLKGLRQIDKLQKREDKEKNKA
ncbi:MAG: DUF3284 domain-containing protein [Erysipelotrichaceae bacterium]